MPGDEPGAGHPAGASGRRARPRPWAALALLIAGVAFVALASALWATWRPASGWTGYSPLSSDLYSPPVSTGTVILAAILLAAGAGAVAAAAGVLLHACRGSARDDATGSRRRD